MSAHPLCCVISVSLLNAINKIDKIIMRCSGEIWWSLTGMMMARLTVGVKNLTDLHKNTKLFPSPPTTLTCPQIYIQQTPRLRKPSPHQHSWHLLSTATFPLLLLLALDRVILMNFDLQHNATGEPFKILLKIMFVNYYTIAVTTGPATFHQHWWWE